MQDTERDQQILRLLYHEQFDLAETREADLQQWARLENVSDNALQEMIGSLLERELVRGADGPLSCRLSARGAFLVEDSGLAPSQSATHQFAVRLALLEALSSYSSNRDAAVNANALADRAGVSAMDCRRNLPILIDAGWSRTNPDGCIEITIKGLQTLHEWRSDVRTRFTDTRRQA